MGLFIKGVLRRWWIVLLVTLVTVIAGTLPRPVQYVADAKILFKVGREYLYQPETGARTSPIASTSGVKNAINGESQILNSLDVKAMALENFGVDKFLSGLKSERVEGLMRLPFIHLLKKDQQSEAEVSDVEKLDSAIESLTNMLRIKTIENTSILHLSLTNSTPENAQDLLDELISVFLTTRQKIYDDTNADLMDDRLTGVSQSLESAEKDLLDFNAENAIYSLDDQQKMLVQQNVNMTQQREQAQASIAELTTRLRLINEMLAETPETVSIFTEQQANKLVQEARGRLFELDLEKNKLLAAFREDSQTVSRIRGEIETVQAFIAEQENAQTATVRTGRNDVYDKLMIDKINVESELIATQSRSESLIESLDRVNEKLLSIDGLRNSRRKFERSIETLEARRRGYQEKADDARFIGDLKKEQRTNARIIQHSTAALKPVGLSLSQRFVLSAILGFIGGLIFASLVQLFSRGGAFSVSSNRHVQLDEQILDVPVLATIGSK